MRKVVVLALLFGAACVDVPRAIRSDFAEPKAHERSNFRRGVHGARPEVEIAPDAGLDADADGEAEPPTGEDGGAP